MLMLAAVPAQAAIFAGLSSANDPDLAIPRIANGTTGGFEASLQEQQSNFDGHGTETLNWIAIQTGSTTANGRKIEVQTVNATDQPTPVTFNNSLNRQFPILIQSLMGLNGSDPAIAEQQDLSKTGVKVRVQEEQSVDAELIHTSEPIAVFAAE